MSDKPTSIIIQGKEYLIDCSEEDKPQLEEVASFLDKQIHDIKHTSKTVDSERIAVLVALNIADELISLKKQNINYDSNINNALQRLYEKIGDALSKDHKLG